eukprot:6941116-Prymnesium_polylepis.1
MGSDLYARYISPPLTPSREKPYLSSFSFGGMCVECTRRNLKCCSFRSCETMASEGQIPIASTTSGTRVRVAGVTTLWPCASVAPQRSASPQQR